MFVPELAPTSSSRLWISFFELVYIMLAIEITHIGNIYTTGIGSYYTSDFFFFLESQLDIYQYSTDWMEF